jgi:hypothetical protein
MSRNQTADEVLEEFRKAYPESVADFAHRLWNDICYLNLSVSAYLQLYSSNETLQILKSSAPQFFGWLQNWLRLTIFLQIGRLTDPAQAGTRINASFAGFSKVLREAGATAAADALDADFKKLEIIVQKVRVIRHRTLAHADLRTVLREDSPLPNVTRKELEVLVDGIGNTYTRADAHFRRTQTYFKGMDMFTGVDALTTFLERGIQSFDEEKQRVLNKTKNKETTV